MTKQTLTAAILSITAAFGVAAPAHAGSTDIISTIEEYNGNLYLYDDPADEPTNPINIGEFTFNLPAGTTLYGAIISGTFGNADVNFNTALSDYFLDSTDDGTTLEVAECDDPSNLCNTSQDTPTPWSTIIPESVLNSDFAAELVDGEEDTLYFNANENGPYAIYTGEITLDLLTTPEPASILFLCGGVAGIALLRRRRKV